uniref:Uncharacterized protein n=1 Tax=Bionectria ochroleuca TaxID=29856 RepID=A0A8H7K3K6_BIOOC
MAVYALTALGRLLRSRRRGLSTRRHSANGGGREQEPTLFSILKLDPFKSPFDEAEKACHNHGSYGKQITDTIMDTVFRTGNIILGRESLHGWENGRTLGSLAEHAMYGLIRRIPDVSTWIGLNGRDIGASICYSGRYMTVSIMFAGRKNVKVSSPTFENYQ